jgi:hypothetical protein
MNIRPAYLRYAIAALLVCTSWSGAEATPRQRNILRPAKTCWQYGSLRSRAFSPRYVEQRLARLERAAAAIPGQSFAMREIGRIGGHPMMRIDMGPSRRTRGNRRPLKVLITAGVHGNENIGIKSTLQFMHWVQGKKELRDNYEFTIVPLINPQGLTERMRRNASDVDLNRAFGNGRFVYESQAVVTALQGEHFDLAVDMHASGKHGFFLIRGGEDQGLAKQALRSMPAASLMATNSATLAPHEDRDKVRGRISVYNLYTLGGAQTQTPGTLKGYMQQNGARHSYTLETPKRLPLKLQLKGTMKLLAATLEAARAQMQ